MSGERKVFNDKNQQATKNGLDGLANMADILMLSCAVIIVTTLILFV